MPPLVKICGLSTPETVDAAIRLGATHIGLVHYEPSPRHVDLKTAAALRQRAGGKVKVALLLVNASQQVTGEALSAVRPDIVQFHGNETPQWLPAVKRLVPAEVWKAVGLKDAGTLERVRQFEGAADRILFDAPAAALPGGFFVVPGVRPADGRAGDQKRIVTPAQAMADGASILVVGRPISQSQDPDLAARAIEATL